MATKLDVTVDTSEWDKNSAAFKTGFKPALQLAGTEAVNEVLDTEGVNIYPPEGSGNQPPTPYYIRGRGTQYASGNKGNSEKFGSSWNVKADGYGARGDNSASYGGQLVGDNDQAPHMARIGWKKLKDAVTEKTTQIQRIYDRWMDKLRRQSGL